MRTTDACLGALPALRRLPPHLGVWVVGAALAGRAPLQRPQPVLRGRQRFGRRDPIHLHTVRSGHHQQIFQADIDTDRALW